jgi:hypothetical protein
VIELTVADTRGLAWAQNAVTAYHYLHAPVDSRCSPLAYLIWARNVADPVGCLIVGRPESTRCYDGKLTYGSLKDVRAGRATFDRWEVLNLARVWLHPAVQAGGQFCRPGRVPGFRDRRGVWRNAVASAAIKLLAERVSYDYLRARPPVYPDEPYQIRVLLSYCDTRLHRGTIYRAAGWQLARVNQSGIQTWYADQVAPLSSYEDDMIRKLAGQAWRSRRFRARRASPETQERFV